MYTIDIKDLNAVRQAMEEISKLTVCVHYSSFGVSVCLSVCLSVEPCKMAEQLRNI